jgi:HEAT repeat protein
VITVACTGLTDPSQARRQVAAIALRELADERSRPPLLAALSDPAASVRRTSVEALGRLAPDALTEQACALALADPDGAVRAAAVKVLAKTASDTDKLLRPLVTDQSVAVRRQIARAGSKLSDETIWILTGDEHADVRAEVLRTLSRQPRAALIPQIIAALSDVSWHVRRRACRALGASADHAARAPLVRTLLDAHPLVRAEARRALRQIFGEYTIDVLAEELQNSETSLRSALIYALARSGDHRAAPFLAPYENDPSADVRIALAHSLVVLAPDEAKQVLRRLLTDRDPAVRNAARVAIDEVETRT